MTVIKEITEKAFRHSLFELLIKWIVDKIEKRRKIHF